MIDVEKFLSGDERELANIIDEYSHSLINYCNGILFNRADAEDAVQNTFIKLYRKRDSLKNPDAFKAFLYRIAYSSSVDIIRARKFFVIPEREPDINQNYISDEMREALLSLEPLDRAIVYGKAVEEYSYSELSDIYGKSEAFMRKRFERAKKKMADKLKKNKFSRRYGQ